MAVSWYEQRPTVSLELLAALGVGPAQSVIDIGGGASALVDHLLIAGHRDVTVLDIATVPLDIARSRLGDPDTVTWITADLLSWQPVRRWDVWHDRAVLHFLTDDADRDTYRRLLHDSLTPNGAFVVGTFAEDGPTHCSGLPVRRYSIEELAGVLGAVEIRQKGRYLHRTPSGADQPFSWVAGRIRSAS
jgi:trans-aconitate methyltransferase